MNVSNWREQALCADAADPDDWYADGPRRDAAVQTCAGCPVQENCLDLAMAEGDAHGVWGGMTVEDRLDLGMEASRETSVERVLRLEREEAERVRRLRGLPLRVGDRTYRVSGSPGQSALPDLDAFGSARPKQAARKPKPAPKPAPVLSPAEQVRRERRLAQKRAWQAAHRERARAQRESVPGPVGAAS